MLSLAAIILFVSLVAAILLTPLARRLALRVDMVDRPAGRKAHGKPIPYLGGLAIIGSFATAFVLSQVLPLEAIAEALSRDTYSVPFVRGGGAEHRQLWVVLGGGIAIFLVGLIDDRYSLRPGIKLVAQIAVASAVAILGVRVDIINPVISSVIAVLWVVGITNSFNFLDNMDGLSAGIAAIVAVMLFIVTAQVNQHMVSLACIALAGAALGFLVFNYHPARIFMGDAGSLFLGFTLACLTMVTTFYRSAAADESAIRLAIPFLVMGLPLFDTGSVLWIRWREGRPLMQGDRSHFSHRLVALGMSVPEAVMTNYLVAAAIGLGASLLIWVKAVGSIVLLLQVLLIFAVVILLERAGRRTP